MDKDRIYLILGRKIVFKKIKKANKYSDYTVVFPSLFRIFRKNLDISLSIFKQILKDKEFFESLGFDFYIVKGLTIKDTYIIIKWNKKEE